MEVQVQQWPTPGTSLDRQASMMDDEGNPFVRQAKCTFLKGLERDVIAYMDVCRNPRVTDALQWIVSGGTGEDTAWRTGEKQSTAQQATVKGKYSLVLLTATTSGRSLSQRLKEWVIGRHGGE